MSTYRIWLFVYSIFSSIVIMLPISFLSPYPEFAILAGIPFIKQRPGISTISGFLVGIFVTLAAIVAKSPKDVWALSLLLGSITSMPSIVILFLYPVIVGGIAASSSFIFSYTTYRVPENRELNSQPSY